MNGSNGRNRLIYTIVGGLTVLGIAGGIRLAVGQGRLETRATNTEDACKKHAKIVEDVPVIVNEIGHIKNSIDDIEVKQDKILDAIEALRR